MENIEQKLREELVPILGLDSVDEVQPDMALVADIGAESIDFVEIMYMIENTFGVKIKISELTRGEDVAETAEAGEQRLTAERAAWLNEQLGPGHFTEGMTTADVFRVFTVHNLARVIENKLAGQ